jgi:hypothetical protein
VNALIEACLSEYEEDQQFYFETKNATVDVCGYDEITKACIVVPAANGGADSTSDGSADAVPCFIVATDPLKVLPLDNANNVREAVGVCGLLLHTASLCFVLRHIYKYYFFKGELTSRLRMATIFLVAGLLCEIPDDLVIILQVYAFPSISSILSTPVIPAILSTPFIPAIHFVLPFILFFHSCHSFYSPIPFVLPFLLFFPSSFLVQDSSTLVMKLTHSAHMLSYLTLAAALCTVIAQISQVSL